MQNPRSKEAINTHTQQNLNDPSQALRQETGMPRILTGGTSPIGIRVFPLPPDFSRSRSIQIAQAFYVNGKKVSYDVYQAHEKAQRRKREESGHDESAMSRFAEGDENKQELIDLKYRLRALSQQRPFAYSDKQLRETDREMEKILRKAAALEMSLFTRKDWDTVGSGEGELEATFSGALSYYHSRNNPYPPGSLNAFMWEKNPQERDSMERNMNQTMDVDETAIYMRMSRREYNRRKNDGEDMTHIGIIGE